MHVLIQECFASRVIDVFERSTYFFIVWLGVYLICFHLMLFFLLEKPHFWILDRSLIVA